MSTLLTILAATCLTSTSCIQETPEQHVPIYRIAVLGASATAGYGVVLEVEEDGKPKKTGIDLTNVFQASQVDQEVVFLDLSSGLFFLRPISYAQAAVTRAKIWQADLVLGIDFLFWCLYGNDDGKGGRLQNEAQRLDKLELGLAILDELDFPVVVGDIPDMTAIGGHLLAQSQRPDPATVQKANERIHEWASERPNVVVTRLHDFIAQIHAQESFTIGPHSWDIAHEDIMIISQDELHPTLDGLIALAQALIESAQDIEEIETQLPPLDLKRDVIYTRLRSRKRSPRRPRVYQPQRSSALSNSRIPSRSSSLSARSSARAIAWRR